ncbi:MAG: HD domain-containing protein, partial [Deltaproteobacteria bacterium]|nr:HD domain-containing protein [Deltaproteobacteria bacterium]
MPASDPAYRASIDRSPGHLAAALNGMVDVESLLVKMLANARLLVGAEAGTVYLAEGGRLRFVSSQNEYLERTVEDRMDLPFAGNNIAIDKLTLAGYSASEMRIITVNDTHDIDPGSPFQHDKSVDASTSYDSKAVISIPLGTLSGDLLGVLQIINPLDESGRVRAFTAEDEHNLSYLAESAALALEKAIMLRRSTLLTVKMVSVQDPSETAGHALRVATVAKELYARWSLKSGVPLTEREHILNILPLAAMLHDVGKNWLPKELLTKPGRLDPTERCLMEGHVLSGAKLFAKPKTSLGRLTLVVITDHHERWDGRGYPGRIEELPPVLDIISGLAPISPLEGLSNAGQGKKGEEISIYGRILAVADVYDALSSRKTYKEAFDESLVVQIMEQESGHHFDPSVIESFMAIQPTLAKLRHRFPESEDPFNSYPL